MELILQICAFVFNLAIIVLGLKFFVCLKKSGLKLFKYFTTLSNFFAIVCSIIFVISLFMYFLFNIPVPQWIKGLRYTASYCLFITMVIVIIFLDPLKNKRERPVHSAFHTGINKKYMDACFHYIIPCLSIISLIIFEAHPVLSLYWILIAAIPIVLYIIVYVILTVTKSWIEPYGLLISKMRTSKKVLIAILIPVTIVILDILLWWASMLFV